MKTHALTVKEGELAWYLGNDSELLSLALAQVRAWNDAGVPDYDREFVLVLSKHLGLLYGVPLRLAVK